MAWVATALATPLVGLIAYESSTHVAGFEPRLLTSDFPDDTDVLTEPLLVEGLGILHLPRYDADTLKEHMKEVRDKAFRIRLPAGPSEPRKSVKEFATAVRSAKPTDYSGLDDLTLIKKALTQYPQYREMVDFREFRIEPVRLKRPLWATGVTLGVVAAVVLTLQGGISVLAWIARGFTDKG